MNQQKFVHDDLVRMTDTGLEGTVKDVHQGENEYFYTVEVKDSTHARVDIPENGLELVKIANDDETGFHIRYVS